LFCMAKLYIVVFHKYKGNRQRAERRFVRVRYRSEGTNSARLLTLRQRNAFAKSQVRQ
jgi:hypothetical protein